VVGRQGRDLARPGDRCARPRGDRRHHRLPAGSVLVRALLHDGFDTIASRPTTVRIKRQPPEVVVHSPKDGEMVLAGSALRLWGAAMQQDGSPLQDEESARWVLDGEGVGRGLDVWLDAPAVGEHTVELVVGRSARAGVAFRVVDPASEFGPDNTSEY
jgi:hypothetical protein